MAAYEMSSYGATYEFLSRNFAVFSYSEFFPGRPFGAVIDGIRNEDATRLTFGDGCFDLVTSNQVLEHVADDIQAFRECYRVLRPGGALVFSVPLYEEPRTEQVACLTEGGLEWLGVPEFHDSRLAGPQSAVVFWRHSKYDIADRVRLAGFRHVEVVPVEVVASQGEPALVVYAVRE